MGHPVHTKPKVNKIKKCEYNVQQGKIKMSKCQTYKLSFFYRCYIIGLFVKICSVKQVDLYSRIYRDAHKRKDFNGDSFDFL